MCGHRSECAFDVFSKKVEPYRPTQWCDFGQASCKSKSNDRRRSFLICIFKCIGCYFSDSPIIYYLCHIFLTVKYCYFPMISQLFCKGCLSSIHVHCQTREAWSRLGANHVAAGNKIHNKIYSSNEKKWIHQHYKRNKCTFLHHQGTLIFSIVIDGHLKYKGILSLLSVPVSWG